ncbi:MULTISPECIES: hypothetical protein [Citricoccus]|uniref:hypothetical protein n=1 Tax=Citricoccus TaxID=169133 RepID=UPI000255E170|nr:hypothetical protein [Citricoccus sp. CH26A]
MEHRSLSPARHRPAIRSAGPGRLRGPARLLRGWAAAVVATLVAAGSHTLAGSSGPGHDAGPAPVVWILTLALAGPLCTALAGRTLSWWRLGSAVASSQLLFHWLYSQSAGTGRPAGPVPADPAGHAGHAAHAGHAGPAAQSVQSAQVSPSALAAEVSPSALAAEVSPSAAAPGPSAGTLPGAEVLQSADHSSLAMVAAHVLAAVVTVLLLRRGEAMAARVVELAVGFVLQAPGARLARWVPAVRRPRLPSRPLAPVLRAGAVVSSALRLRGPPVPALSR